MIKIYRIYTEYIINLKIYYKFYFKYILYRNNVII